MVLTGDVKEKKTLPFNNPTSCNTIHALSPLPNDLVTELLKQIVNREVTCSQANNKAKELRATALAREYILDTAKKHYPKATKDFKNWGHLIKQWPQLDHVADTAVGYFKKKNRQQRQHIPALERDVLATIKLQEDIRTKRIDPTKVDREEYPWLLAPMEEPRVFVTSIGTMHFIMLNCKTESASAWLQKGSMVPVPPLSFCWADRENWFLH